MVSMLYFIKVSGSMSMPLFVDRLKVSLKGIILIWI